ncbi:hypothetical protein SADUNF_Sadunf11G0110800 [Salix dunnii]|uniref:RING-CH-type domain-containing protein n=1 Tax=Salix dunnii TaxID=1413687 RepID=A0A835MNH3_9ROSI|nr:hypothetical protein SADUNF_Sadunf11G0110800 [Salix dunnii]
MQNDGSGRDGTTRAGGDVALTEIDLEKQDNSKVLPQEGGNRVLSGNYDHSPVIAIVVSNGESPVSTSKEEFRSVDSPRKGSLSRTSSSHEQCSPSAALVTLLFVRVCQQEKEEALIDLGCKCKGGLAKSHRTCIDTWFSTRGSNKCEICQAVAENVSPPESQPIVGILYLSGKNYNMLKIALFICLCSKFNMHWVLECDASSCIFFGTKKCLNLDILFIIRNCCCVYFMKQTNYWVWRIDPNFRPRDRDRGCFSPLWVAFSILIGGLLLDVLISITLGVSALPVNIIIGVIVVLGLGTALRLALEFCHEWSFRRAVQRADANENHGYHPAM